MDEREKLWEEGASVTPSADSSLT